MISFALYVCLDDQSVLSWNAYDRRKKKALCVILSLSFFFGIFRIFTYRTKIYGRNKFELFYLLSINCILWYQSTVQNHKRLSFDFIAYSFFILSWICYAYIWNKISRFLQFISAKNQLLLLFETHSPWLICYHFGFCESCTFIAEVELKSDSMSHWFSLPMSTGFLQQQKKR